MKISSGYIWYLVFGKKWIQKQTVNKTHGKREIAARSLYLYKSNGNTK